MWSASELGAAWASLPPELQAAVLAMLPPRERARARLVCKDWKEWLDTNNLCWAGVRRLTIECGDVWTSECEEPEWSWSAKPDPDATFTSALRFLAPRCPLVSLELIKLGTAQEGLLLGWTTAPDGAPLLRMLGEATSTPMKLRCLLACDWGFKEDETPAVRSSLNLLIQSQPRLEMLVLGAFSAYRQHYLPQSVLPPSYLHQSGLLPQEATDSNPWRWLPSYVNLASLEVVDKLEHLRVLCLFYEKLGDTSGLPESLLRRLSCLSICYCHAKNEEGAKKAVQKRVRRLAPGLKFRKHMKESDRFSRIIWAKVGFDVDNEMADNALHSCNAIRDYDSLIS